MKFTKLRLAGIAHLAMSAMMASSETERRQMGVFGRKHIERNFALDRVVGCWSGLLNDLVGAVA
jgi:hypothetical protein